MVTKLLGRESAARILDASNFSSQTMPARRYPAALFCIALVFAASIDLRTQRAPQPADGAAQPAAAVTAATLNKYCATCHNEKVRAGGFTLDTLNLDDPGS